MMKKITAGNFKRYGWVIGYLAKERLRPKENIFCIVLKEKQRLGWRIAYLVLRDRHIAKLEQHPDSYESLEPVKGKTILYVSASKNPSKIESFILDRPVILRKKIWHGVVTASPESEIKITENAVVRCIYRELAFNLPAK